jgi:hypothetical protein
VEGLLVVHTFTIHDMDGLQPRQHLTERDEAYSYATGVQRIRGCYGAKIALLVLRRGGCGLRLSRDYLTRSTTLPWMAGGPGLICRSVVGLLYLTLEVGSRVDYGSRTIQNPRTKRGNLYLKSIRLSLCRIAMCEVSRWSVMCGILYFLLSTVGKLYLVVV